MASEPLAHSVRPSVPEMLKEFFKLLAEGYDVNVALVKTVKKFARNELEAIKMVWLIKNLLGLKNFKFREGPHGPIFEEASYKYFRKLYTWE